MAYIHYQYNVRSLSRYSELLNQLRELCFHTEHIGKLGKSPAPVIPVIIHTRDPIGVHSRLLGLGIFPSLSFDLNNQIQKIIVATAIINEHDKVRDVRPHFRPKTIGYFQAEIVVLDVGFDVRMGFSNAAKLLFPAAVEDDP